MKSCDCSVKGQEFPLSEGICLKMCKMTQLFILVTHIPEFECPYVFY